MSTLKNPRTLWQDGDFLKFWAGETIAQIGEQVTKLALPLTVILTMNAGPTQVGIVNATYYAPFLAVTLFVGAWVDRVRRRPLMIASNVLRVLLVASVPVLGMAHLLTLWYVYLAALLIGVLTVIFDVAYQSYLPSLIGKEQLIEGNSKLQASASIAQVGGPGLGGLLIELTTAPIAMLVTAASFAVSVTTLTSIRRAEPRPSAPARRRSMWRDVGAGISVVGRNGYLRACALQSGIYNFCWMSLSTVFVLYAIRDEHYNAGTLGLVMSGGALGSLIGSITARRLKNRFGLGTSIVGALFVCCAAPLLVPAAPGSGAVPMTMFAVAFTGTGFGATVANVQIISLRQAITPELLLGRMNAGYRFISWGMLPLGALFGGWLGGVIGLRPTLYTTGYLFLLAPVVVLLSPVRRLKDFPAQIEERRADSIPVPAEAEAGR